MQIFRGVFVEDKKLYSNLLIWRLLRDTSGYISEKILTSFLLSRYVCSYIKTKGLLQYQTITKEWFDIFFFQNPLRESMR